MLDKSLFRSELFRILGEADAQRFLTTLHFTSRTKGRLFYWQEKMLGKLSSELSIPPLSFEDALGLLNYCYLHGDELVEGSAPIVYGTFASAESTNSKHRHQIYAISSVRGPCWVEEATHRTVFYCPTCRQVEKQLTVRA
jgi:hypothetical protein